jgi:hypothetical protein
MSRNNDDYVATKAEQTFNDEGETIKVAEVPSSPNKTKFKCD